MTQKQPFLSPCTFPSRELSEHSVQENNCKISDTYIRDFEANLAFPILILRPSQGISHLKLFQYTGLNDTKFNYFKLKKNNEPEL